jgi:peptide/nickel transport system substrate-binding protein
MRKVSVVLILALVLVLILTACASTPPTTSMATTTVKPTTSTPTTLTPKYGGVLKIVPRLISQVFGYPKDMSYSQAVDNSAPCLESLVGVSNTGEFVTTKLATAYQVAPDGKSVTFTLRKGVKFHDGTDFNATAAKWSLDLIKASKAVGTEQWTTIDAVDDYTVRINLKKFTNTLMDAYLRPLPSKRLGLIRSIPTRWEQVPLNLSAIPLMSR